METIYAKGDTYRMDGADHYTAGINVGDHGNRIEIHGPTIAEAETLRDHVLASLTGGLGAIGEEHRRRFEIEGWLSYPDDQLVHGEMAMAASVYCKIAARPWLFGRSPTAAFVGRRQGPRMWDLKWLKPTNERRDIDKSIALLAAKSDRIVCADTRVNLATAGALIVAEIDMIDRASARGEES